MSISTPAADPIAKTDHKATGPVAEVSATGSVPTPATVVSEWIYILELEEKKYYVGRTKYLLSRLEQHETGMNGSAWTRLYRPIKIVDQFLCTSEHAEENTTVDLMRDKGIPNIRGSIYVQDILPEHQVLTLMNRLSDLNKECFNCGKRGHYVNKCPAPHIEKVYCSKCGRNNHTVQRCYAKTDVNGRPL